MKRKKYEKELYKLQVQLCHLQRWVKEKGLRVVIVFEGRDGAGKGGTIRAITERLSPRVFRVVALPAPSDREKTQVYFQRYLQQFPAAGEVVIFDRSWYNRAGVEYVMGFCTDKQHKRFLTLCPQIEKFLVEGGTTLIKVWMEVSNDEQKRRFEARIKDPLRQWKLSPMDLPSRKRWYDYSRARDMMLKKTDTRIAPWHIVRSDNKRAARLNTISHLLSTIPYKKLPQEKVKLPGRSTKDTYDDDASIARRRFVKERYRDAGRIGSRSARCVLDCEVDQVTLPITFSDQYKGLVDGTLAYAPSAGHAGRHSGRGPGPGGSRGFRLGLDVERLADRDCGTAGFTQQP
jgi:polyphosphate kinase 2